jgi:hypothetical protein
MYSFHFAHERILLSLGNVELELIELVSDSLEILSSEHGTKTKTKKTKNKKKVNQTIKTKKKIK